MRENWSHDRPHFYKYMSADTAKIVLTNSTLRWSSPILFNDPFDVQFDLHVEYDKENVIELALNDIWLAYSGGPKLPPKNLFVILLEVLRAQTADMSEEELKAEFRPAIEEGLLKAENALPRFHQEVRQVISDVKLLCFSEVFDNILMWSHYGKDHSGVVLRFSCIEELDSAWGAATPVRYRKKMPLLLDEKQTVSLFLGDGPNRNEILNDSVYTKAEDWSYEREWRLFGGRDQTKLYEDFKFDEKEMTAVYFGCRMTEGDRNEIMQLTKERFPQAEMFFAKKSERSFSLEFSKHV